VNVRDWRTLSSAGIAPLYQSELARWEDVLHWDTRANWRLVEAARAAGTLPGVVACDASGAVRGWAFYLRHHQALQIGALVCASPAATRAVLGAILDSPEAGAASSVTFFTFADAPGLDAALQQDGFSTRRYRYLDRPLTAGITNSRAGPFGPARESGSTGPGLHTEVSGAGPAAVGDTRSWQPADLVPVAELLSRAYAGPDRARPFVPQGRPGDWIEYVGQLVMTRGCGVFLPGASLIDESSPGVDAVVLATCLGPGTAHLAQVAVDPAAQRSGRGRLIVAAALANLRAADYVRATLLVAAANGAANRLYGELGFVEAATFIAASRDQPRRG
jgi:ribosomal protein S18 acetylase RimI-like enzyme